MNKVQKYLAVALLTVPVFTACNQEKVDQLTDENITLANRNKGLNKELEGYLKTFNEIEDNLNEIKEREANIVTSTADGVEYKETDRKASVVRDMTAINALMKENRAKMASLQSRLKSSDSEFKKMVASLNYRLREKDEELNVLKTDLETLNIEKEQLTQNVSMLASKVDTLSATTEEQADIIEEQSSVIEERTTALNTAFVAIGSYRDLRDEKVVVKEGGLLGIGSTEKLSEEMNYEAFSKIDITQVRSIPVVAKKVDLVSAHPQGSYEFELNEEENVEKLVILDPEKFWESSKYLVVLVE